jgi:cell division protein FtsI/penicillin-binding protein 2
MNRAVYPAGHVAANLIGFTNIDGQGIEGVEKSFNAQLSGKPGVRQVREDRYGRVVENLTEIAPVPAHNIQLVLMSGCKPLPKMRWIMPWPGIKPNQAHRSD